MLWMTIFMIVAVLASVALLAVVAISVGVIALPASSPIDRAATWTQRQLDGEGTPPAVFDRLDARR